MKFIIDRKKWYRGKGAESSCLLKKNGMMCCVGQMCRQCGVGTYYLEDVGEACDILDEGMNDKVRLIIQPWLDDAYTVNDEETFGDAFREYSLTKMAADNGHELIFEG